jgi:transcriptional regulator with XRE-family HTH domain
MASSQISDKLKPRIARHRRRIARALARARARTGLSLDSVARISGIHRQRWLRYENARCAIPSELLPLLAEAVNSNVGELVAA